MAAKSLGTQFDSKTWRFLKANVLAVALEKSSRGDAEYVDEIGYDMLVDDVKIEIKTQKNAFTKKLDTYKLRIKNTMGEKQEFPNTFDYLLVVSTEPPYLAALASWEDVTIDLDFGNDVIKSKIMKENLTFLTPESGFVLEDKTCSDYSIKEYVNKGISQWVDSIEK